MKMKLRQFFSVSVLAILMCLLFSVLSCSRHGGNTLAAEFDRIDTLIRQGQYNTATEELRKVEKRLTASWDFISVFRRYNNLGETARALQVISDAYKKHNLNGEVIALYTYALLRAAKIDEAVKVSEVLSGTRYGSFYSEALLRQAAANGASSFGSSNSSSSRAKNSTASATASSSSASVSNGTSKDSNVPDSKLPDNNLTRYLAPEFFSVYYDAYTGSRESFWLRNAALISLINGDTEKVHSLHPERYTSFADAYFWALVQFDIGNYGGADEALSQARILYETSPRRDRQRVTDIQFAALASDLYQALSEADRAEEARRELLARLKDSDIDLSDAELPYIYLNSTQYAVGAGNDGRAIYLLLESVKNWPDFVPALVTYANFAYNSSKSRVENETQRTLRESGVATLEMQRYDARAKIPVADAISRMEKSLERTHDPLLYIALLDLQYKTDTTIAPENKIADLWSVLERNSTGINKYPELLFEYAVNMLIRYNRTDDAFDLFQRYCRTQYEFEAGADFWKQLLENVRKMPLSQAECAAYFAATKHLGTTAQKLYEYCVFESSGGDFRGSKAGSAQAQVAANVSVESCMNLADIYSAFAKRKEALSLYAVAAGRTPDVMQKAEIMYRMAVVYSEDGNTQDAARTAAVACTFNPSHAKAQYLLARLRAAK